MRISDWSSDVCCSDLFHDWAEYQPTREQVLAEREAAAERKRRSREKSQGESQVESRRDSQRPNGGSHSPPSRPVPTPSPDSSTYVKESSYVGNRAQETPVDKSARNTLRSEEHTSELQSLMRISYAVFYLKKKTSLTATNKNNYDR